MSLIKDVNEELKTLPLDKKNLRKFGLMIGGIFIIISILFSFYNSAAIAIWILVTVGGLLLIFGLIAPKLLRVIYIWWMTGAIVLGWFVSRFILTILFFLVITPIGLIAKIVGKKFLDLKYKDNKNSYWHLIPPDKKTDYNKMY